MYKRSLIFPTNKQINGIIGKKFKLEKNIFDHKYFILFHLHVGLDTNKQKNKKQGVDFWYKLI